MLYNYLGFKTVGAEMRAASAVDIALWDILGQVTNQPIYQLLGGATRDKVRAYNTCAGYQYVRAKSEQGTANFGMPADGGKYQPYEDLVGFMKYADELAVSLLDEGYTGMKIWPFDEYAEASNGTYISNADLKKAMQPFEKIRKAVGDKMDIHVEFHSLWNLPTAIKIAKALEQFDPFWYEDPIKMDNLDAIAEYAHRTDVWVTASETLGTRWALPRPVREARGQRVHVRRRLDRRPERVEEDRHHGGGLPAAGCAARLHRPDPADRFGASVDELPEHAGAGSGAGVLLRLVRQAGHAAAAVEERLRSPPRRDPDWAPSCSPMCSSARMRGFAAAACNFVPFNPVDSVTTGLQPVATWRRFCVYWRHIKTLIKTIGF